MLDKRLNPCAQMAAGIFMPRLLGRHEKFARAIAAGKTQTEAYKLAGYKVSSDKIAGDSASRLMRNDKVAERVAELLETGIDAENVTPELIIKGLLEIATDPEVSDGSRQAAWKTLAQVRSMLIQVHESRYREMTDEQLADKQAREIAGDDEQLFQTIRTRILDRIQ